MKRLTEGTSRMVNTFLKNQQVSTAEAALGTRTSAPQSQPRSENGVMSPALEGQGPGSPPPLRVLAPASQASPHSEHQAPGPWPSSLPALRPWPPAAPAQAGSGHSGCPAGREAPDWRTRGGRTAGSFWTHRLHIRKPGTQGKQNIILTAKASPRELPRWQGSSPRWTSGFIRIHRLPQS